MATYTETEQYSFIGDKNALGGLPAVEQTQAFIAAFKGVISSTPEQIANSSFFITYLVDEEGKVYKVAEDSDAQRDILFNFAPEDDVIVRVDQGTLLNTQLAGEHKVTGIGSFVPIFVTQTGSSDNAYVPFVNFVNPGEELQDATTVPNFLATSFISSSTNFPAGFQVTSPSTGNPVNVSYGNGFPIYDYGLRIASGALNTSARTFIGQQYNGSTLFNWYSGSSPDESAASWDMDVDGFTLKTGSYVIADPKDESINNITFTVSYGLYNFRFNTSTARIALFRKRGSTYSIIEYQDIALPSLTDNIVYAIASLTEGSLNFTISTNDIEANDEFLPIVSSPSIINLWANNTALSTTNGYANAQTFDGIFLSKTTQTLGDGTQVDVPYFSFAVTAQSPGVNVTQPQPDYFTTGSSASTVITASSVLSSEYGNYQQLPTASSDFGFSPINYPFEIQPGDKVRFGYNKENIFTIFRVDEPPGSNLLYLTLDRAVGGNLNLKNVVIYRNLSDGKFITLDVNKNDPQFTEVDFTGIIIPRYASPRLKENANDIIAKLKSEGILTED